MDLLIDEILLPFTLNQRIQFYYSDIYLSQPDLPYCGESLRTHRFHFPIQLLNQLMINPQSLVERAEEVISDHHQEGEYWLKLSQNLDQEEYHLDLLFQEDNRSDQELEPLEQIINSLVELEISDPGC